MSTTINPNPNPLAVEYRDARARGCSPRSALAVARHRASCADECVPTLGLARDLATRLEWGGDTRDDDGGALASAAILADGRVALWGDPTALLTVTATLAPFDWPASPYEGAHLDETVRALDALAFAVHDWRADEREARDRARAALLAEYRADTFTAPGASRQVRAEARDAFIAAVLDEATAWGAEHLVEYVATVTVRDTATGDEYAAASGTLWLDERVTRSTRADRVEHLAGVLVEVLADALDPRAIRAGAEATLDADRARYLAALDARDRLAAWPGVRSPGVAL